MTDSLPTRGQLERTLSQRIQALYRNYTGHRPNEVVCQIFDQKVAIILESSITQVEQLLFKNGKEALVAEVHSTVNDVIEPHVKQTIEEVMGVAVVDLLSDAKLKTERTGMIAVLSDSPQMRDRAVSNKLKEK